MKVSIIGAGNVGALTAMRIAEAGLADVVLVDILEGISRGKALDLSQASPIISHSRRICGTGQYQDIKASDIVIVTAGITRSGDMSREELLLKNAEIVRSVVNKVKSYCPDCIMIVVTNPLDIMSYLAYSESKFDSKKVLGMAGVLDSARFSWFISQQMGLAIGDVKGVVLAGHGDSMVCLPRFSTVKGKPVSELLDEKALDKIIERTRKAGSEIVSLLGKGSAYFSPSAAIYVMVKSIILDEKKTFPVSAYLQGQYGLSDIYLGVPVKLGRSGVEEVIKLPLNKQELSLLHHSAEITRKGIRRVLPTTGQPDSN